MKSVVICLIVVFTLIAMFGYFIYLRPAKWRHLGRYGTNVRYFTCKKCGSTKHIERRIFLKYIPIVISDKIKYQAPGWALCKHKWQRGISKANPTPVFDGNVVLVRKNGKYGAFILNNQKGSPGNAEYEWRYQADGSGNLDK